MKFFTLPLVTSDCRYNPAKFARLRTYYVRLCLLLLSLPSALLVAVTAAAVNVTSHR